MERLEILATAKGGVLQYSLSYGRGTFKNLKEGGNVLNKKGKKKKKKKKN